MKVLCQKEWLPPPLSSSQEGLSTMPCSMDEEPQARPNCDCSGRGWRKYFCSQILCVQVVELSQGVELYHLHHLHLQTLRELQGSQRQPSHSPCGYTNSKNKNPIACYKQNHKHCIKLLTETALKQVQKNNNQNRLPSYNIWKIQNSKDPEHLWKMEGQSSTAQCNCSDRACHLPAWWQSFSQGLDTCLGSLTAFPTPTWQTQQFRGQHLGLEISVPVYVIFFGFLVASNPDHADWTFQSLNVLICIKISMFSLTVGTSS